MGNMGRYVMVKENLKDKVYSGIYDDVTNGIYMQNDILTEGMLIEKYNVSKSPVREALIELCKDGILKSIPRMGYQVTPVTLKEVLDILEFRVDIEVSGLRKIYYSVDGADLDALEKLALRHIGESDQIVSKNWSRNYEFHTFLYSLNSNACGCEILKQIIKKSSRYISQYFQSAWQRESESRGRYHAAVVEMLKKGDGEGACRMLEKDILAVKEEILSLHGRI